VIYFLLLVLIILMILMWFYVNNITNQNKNEVDKNIENINTDIENINTDIKNLKSIAKTQIYLPREFVDGDKSDVPLKEWFPSIYEWATTNYTNEELKRITFVGDLGGNFPDPLPWTPVGQGWNTSKVGLVLINIYSSRRFFGTWLSTVGDIYICSAVRNADPVYYSVYGWYEYTLQKKPTL